VTPFTSSSTTLAVEAHTGFNESLESRNFIVPGVVAIVMAVIGTFLTSLTIAREWERGTMEQLISTPVHPLEMLAGKLAPYFVIGMVDVALCVGVAVWWFGVPFRGSPTALFAASVLFLAAVLLLGFVISARAGSQLAASQFAMILTFLPSFLLSGFAFPIEQMPAAVRAITVAIPARYDLVILKGVFFKGVFFKGTGILTDGGQFVALLAFRAIIGALAIRTFRKQLA
jgi:ABC-2 type transport system permease protein